MNDPLNEPVLPVSVTPAIEPEKVLRLSVPDEKVEPPRV
jgi:hypothetical protein